MHKIRHESQQVVHHLHMAEFGRNLQGSHLWAVEITVAVGNDLLLQKVTYNGIMAILTCNVQQVKSLVLLPNLCQLHIRARLLQQHHDLEESFFRCEHRRRHAIPFARIERYFGLAVLIVFKEVFDNASTASFHSYLQHICSFEIGFAAAAAFLELPKLLQMAIVHRHINRIDALTVFLIDVYGRVGEEEADNIK